MDDIKIQLCDAIDSYMFHDANANYLEVLKSAIRIKEIANVLFEEIKQKQTKKSLY